MVVLTVVFFVLLFFVTFDFVQSRYKNILFAAAGFFLILLAGFRPAGIDRDYLSYVRIFKNSSLVDNILVEPSFMFIASVLKSFSINNPVFLFFIYATIGITTKFIAIKKLSHFWFLSVLMYFSYFFILHEMTQIRAGVAVGFLLLSIVPLYERKAFLFFLFATIAFLFHFSAVLVFFIWFLKPGKINLTLYALLVPGAYILYFFTSFIATDLLLFLPEGMLLSKVAKYEYINGSPLNIFNTWQLMRCLLCFFFLYNINAIHAQNQYAILLVKMYVISTIAFVLLASNPALSGRVSDLFSIGDIILVPCLVAVIKPKWAGILAVMLIAFSYIILHLYFNKIIQ